MRKLGGELVCGANALTSGEPFTLEAQAAESSGYADHSAALL
jgi:hypothetical protein